MTPVTIAFAMSIITISKIPAHQTTPVNQQLMKIKKLKAREKHHGENGRGPPTNICGKEIHELGNQVLQNRDL
ncbi:hypothetical protein C5167_011450 [Papaver somniferum]|uniref:Uncharacterized protein n=1 Tax=Papaver somniferum TaxID=3469 RepID=A0A4Y7K6Z0_PAPSO|nr:hypothetical protein C5167_011450 [Papaver somniferum]